MALALQQRVGVETIATVTTWDKSIMSLQADLLGAHALGIRSVVSTTGSPPVFGDYPAVDGTWEVDSVGLTALLAGLNAGRDSNGLALTVADLVLHRRAGQPDGAGPRRRARAGAREDPGGRAVPGLPPGLRARRAHPAGRGARRHRRAAAAFRRAAVPRSRRPTTSRTRCPASTIPAATLDVMERAGRSGGRAAVGLDLAASLLAKARPLVSGVILTAPGDDPAALAPLLDALG